LMGARIALSMSYLQLKVQGKCTLDCSDDKARRQCLYRHLCTLFYCDDILHKQHWTASSRVSSPPADCLYLVCSPHPRQSPVRWSPPRCFLILEKIFEQLEVLEVLEVQRARPYGYLTTRLQRNWTSERKARGSLQNLEVLVERESLK
jgi:hypothetical protein